MLGDTFLQSVIHYAETDSTNSQAIELLASNTAVELPCLLYTESQVAGRGRGANPWWSAGGSLTFSLIVDFSETTFSVEQKPLLPLLTGMAVARVGETLLPDAEFTIKWPNDVYLAGRKLAGVLIEVPSSKSSARAVIGVGLNVNNSFAEAPEDLASTGISLADHSGTQYDRMEILTAFVREFESLIKSFTTSKSFLDDWRGYCLLTGKQVTLQTGATEVQGSCCGVDEAGALVLETSGGRQSFFGGVVRSWT